MEHHKQERSEAVVDAMADVNKIILVGNLGSDPEMRYLVEEGAVANLRIVTTGRFKNHNGDMQEQTNWHNVVFFGKPAEICGQYLKKGNRVYVEGSLRTRKWQDKDGNDRYITEILGDRILHVSWWYGSGSGAQQEE